MSRAKGSSLLTAAMALTVLSVGPAAHAVEVDNWTDLKTNLELGNDIKVIDNFKSLGEAISVSGSNGITFDMGEYTVTGGTISQTPISVAAENFVLQKGFFKGFENDSTNGSVLDIAQGGSVTISGTVFQTNATVQSGTVYNAGIISIGSYTEGSGESVLVNRTVFTGNKASGDGGGAIYNAKDATISSIEADFSGNTTAGNGGAIYNDGKILVIKDSGFDFNTATKNGGAIYSTQDIKIEAENSNVVFSDNTAAGLANDIYMDAQTDGSLTLALDAADSKSITIGSGLDGNKYNVVVNQKGTSLGEVNFNANVSADAIDLYNGTLNNASGAVITGDVNVYGGNFNNNGELNGTLNVNSDFVMSTGSVNSLNNVVGYELSQSAGTVKGDVTNAGVYNYTGGTVEGAVRNTGTVNATDVGLKTVVNDNILNVVYNNDYSAATTEVLNISQEEGKEGNTTISVDTGKTVSLNVGDIKQDSLKTTGDGHLELSGGSISAKVTNQMTGDTLVIGTTIDGDFVNDSADSHAQFVDGAAVTGTITNDGILDIDSSSYIIQKGITSSTADTSAGQTNIGGASVVLQSGQQIVQKTVNVETTGNFAFDAGSVSTDGQLLTNNGIVGLGSGDNDLAISGAGTTQITGNVQNSSTIEQSEIEITTGSLTTAADTVTANIENNATNGLILTGGTNANAITGTGSAQITGDVINSGTITQNSVAITTGTLTTNASNVTAGIVNDVTDGLTLTGGTNANAISGTGSTQITGDVSNTGTIAQNSVTITSGSLTTGASNVTADIANNVADGLILTGGTNANAITGTGSTQITGAVTNSGTINQSEIEITTGSLTTEADDVTASIKNVATNGLILTGGTNANAITGTGSTQITGNVQNSSTIEQSEIEITTGSLTTAADTVTANIENNATNGLILTGGTNENAITGTGSAKITGDVINSGTITQNSVAITTGTLTTNASNVTAGIVNDVTDGLTLTGGTNANAISGTGSTQIKGVVTNTGTIEQSDIEIVSGRLTTDASNVMADVINDKLAGLILTGGTNANAITGTGSTQITGAVTNSGTINQSEIEITTGSLTTNASRVTADVINSAANGLVLTAGTNANAITGTGSTEITGDVTNNGTIKQSSLEISSGSLTTNAGDVVADITNSVNNGLVLTGGTNANEVSGTGSTKITGDVVNTSVISQDVNLVSGSFENAAGTVSGKLNVADGTVAKSDGTLSNVQNAGRLEISDGSVGAIVNNATAAGAQGVYQSGGQVTGNVTNKGYYELAAGDINAKISNTASTSSLHMLDGSVKEIENIGTVTQDAGFVEVVTNNGTYVLNDGAITGTYTQDAYNTSSLTLNGGTFELGTGSSVTKGSLVLNNDLTVDGGTLTAGASNASVTIASGKNLNILTGDVVLDGSSDLSKVTWNGNINLNGTGSLTLKNIVDASRVSGGASSNKTGSLNASSGNLTVDGSTVLLGNDDLIADAVVFALNGDIIVEDNAEVHVSSADSWTAGQIAQSGGELVIDGVSTNADKSLVSTDGVLEIKNTVVLDNSQDTIGTDTDLLIASGNTLDIKQTSATGVNVMLGDVWAGGISQNGGVLKIAGNTHTTSATKTFNMSAGNLTLDVAGLVLGTSDSKLTGGTVNVNNGSNLSIDNGELNNAVIVSDNNAGNTVSVGGTNNSTLTLSAGSALSPNTSVTINSNGILNSNADYIAGNVTDNGVYNISGGTVKSSVTGTGQTVIDGDVVSDASIATSGGISINYTTTADASKKAKLTIDADNLNADTANNGELVLDAGTLTSNVTGIGSTEIVGNVINDASISQETGGVTISTGSLTTNASLTSINADIENNAVDGLVLTGGKNENQITGTGSARITGNVENAASISQDYIEIVSGKLITNASSTSIDADIENDVNGGLVFTGGVNDNTITGAGSTIINGEVTNSGSISQAEVEISSSGKLITNASSTSIDADIENNATEGLVLVGGTNENTITGSGSVLVDASGVVSNEGTINQVVTLVDGVFQNVSGSINNMLNVSAGTSAEILGGNITSVNNQGTFAVSGGDVTNLANTSVATQTGGNVQTVTNSASYSISDGAITSSIANDNASSTLAVSGTASVNSILNTLGTTTQTGGNVTNVTNSSIYEISDGSIDNTITNNLATSQLEISGGAAVNSVLNTLGTTTQDGGSVESVTNASTYNQSAGSVDTVSNSSNYTISGGDVVSTITNTAAGSTLDISGTANINSVVNTLGITTQTEGYVGIVSNASTYNQSAGSVDTVTNSGAYSISGGEIQTSVSNTTVGSTLGISGTALVNTVTNTLGTTTQTGGSVTNVVNVDKYNQSAGNVDIVDNSGTYAQSGGDIVSVANTGTYTQSAGTVDTVENSASYSISGGSVVTSVTNNNSSSELVISEASSSVPTSVTAVYNTTGSVQQSGGTVAFVENADSYAQSAGDVQDVINTGNYVISNGTISGSFIQDTSDTSSLTIDGGNVNFDAASSITKGNLVLNNDLVVSGGTITTGDSNASIVIASGSTLDVQSGSVTLDGGSDLSKVTWDGVINLDGGSLVLKNIVDETKAAGGDYNKTGSLNAQSGDLTIDAGNVLLGSGDIINDAVNMIINGNIIVDSGSELYISSPSDIWNNGSITLLGTGILSMEDIGTNIDRTLNAQAGVLNILGTVALDNANDVIKGDTTLNLAAGNTLEIMQTSADGVTVNAGDDWSGEISQNGGVLNIAERTDETSDTKIFNITDGTLNLNEAELTLATADSAMSGGTVNITNGSGLTLDNGTNNSAIIISDGTATNTLTVGGVNASTSLLDLEAGSLINANTTLTIADNGVLNSNADYIDTEVFDDGIYNITGGTVKAAVSGTGQTIIDGEVDANAAISTTTGILISDATTADPAQKGKLTISATNVQTTVENNGDLTLETGDLDYAVSGTGATVIDGEIVSTASIGSAAGITILGTTTADPTLKSKLTISADNLDVATLNNGDLVLEAGTLDYVVNGNGATEITGDVINNSTITQAVGGVAISSGSLTTNASDVLATITNDVADGLILTDGTNINTVNGSGSTKIDTVGTVTNTGEFNQDVNVATGTFENTSGTINNTLTIADAALAINQGTLNAVVNDGTFELTDGTVETITNNAVSAQGVYQTGGQVNTDVTNSGYYTISNGSVDGVFNNDTSASILEMTGGTLASITNAGAVAQSAGTVTANVDNSANYTITDGQVDGTFTNQTATSRLDLDGGVIATIDNAGVVEQTAGSVTGAVTNTNEYDISGGSISGVVTNSGTMDISGTASVADIQNTTGVVNQSAGSVASVTNTADYNLSGGSVDTYNQSSGSLAITDGASLTLDNTPAPSVISGGSVTLGSATSEGTLTIANNTTNQANINTNGASVLDVQSGSTLTTLTGTSIADAAVVSANGILNVAAGDVTLNANDNWNGTVNVSDAGVLNLGGVTQDATASLSQITDGETNIISNQELNGNTTITSGEFNIKNTGTTLTMKGGTITSGESSAVVNIETGTTLDILGGTVTLDGGSDLSKVTWDGTVNLNAGGSLILKNIVDQTRVGATAVYNKTGVLNATGGDLSIESTTVLLGESDVIADAVNLNLTGDIVVSDSADVYVDSSDTWSDSDITQIGGSLTLDGVSTDATTSLESTGGTLDVIGTVTLNNTNDTIGSGTTLNVASGNKLDIRNTAATGVTLDSGDTWTGQLDLVGGVLNIVGRDDTTSATQTLNQTGGTLNLDGTEMTFATADSKVAAGVVNVNNSSSLTFDNGIANQGAIVSDATSNNITVGGTNGATLTIDLGSDVNAATTLTVENNGILNSANDYIKSEVTNKGTYNLNNGVIANDISGDGTLNLTGANTSNAGVAIEQHNVHVDDGSLTMGGALIVRDTLNITNDGSIVNNSDTILAETLTNSGSISGTDGEIYIGGLMGTDSTNSGSISQKDIIVSSHLANSGTITSTGSFMNQAIVDGSGSLTVNNATLKANVSQNAVTVKGATTVGETTSTPVQLTANTLTLDNAAATVDVIENSTVKATSLVNNGGNPADVTAGGGVVGDGTLVVTGGTNTGVVNVANISVAKDGTTAGVLDNSGLIQAKELLQVEAGEKITGTGTLKTLNSGNTSNNAGVISQAIVDLGGNFANEAGATLSAGDFTLGASLALDNDGTLEVLKDFNNSGIVNNEADMILGDSANPAQIMPSLNIGKIQGNGTLTVYADIENNGEISQDTIVIKENGRIATSLDKFNATTSLKNDGKFDITGGDKLTFDISSDGKGTGEIRLLKKGDFQIASAVANNTIYQSMSNLSFANPEANIAKSNLDVSGGSINLRNNKFDTLSMQKLSVTGKSKMFMDADLVDEKMDNLKITSFARANNGKITIDANLPDALKDIRLTNSEIKLSPIHSGVKGNLRKELAQALEVELPDEITTPIFMYKPSYNSETGTITIGAEGGYGGFNPAIMASPAAQQSAYLNQLNTYEQAFLSIDNLMSLPQKERTAMLNRNKYAYEGGLITYDPNQLMEESSGVWANPYAAYDKVGLKRGPKVKDFSYGTIVGLDMGMKQHKNGWNGLYNAYVGYNGNSLKYDNVKMNLNGGVVGATGVWYKGNFFTGLTASIGANAAEANTMYGSEDFSMLSTGIASKTGYNFEFFNGNMILQPSWMMSYSMVNTFDYTNAAGVRVKSDPLNAMTIQPGLKVIGNTKSGWQPYAGISMVWNIMDRTQYTAQDVSLPRTSIKPYIQYGVGVKKSWGDRFSGWGQIALRNGGRNGIAAQMGFKMMLGDGAIFKPKNIEMPETPMVPQLQPLPEEMPSVDIQNEQPELQNAETVMPVDAQKEVIQSAPSVIQQAPAEVEDAVKPNMTPAIKQVVPVEQPLYAEPEADNVPIILDQPKFEPRMVAPQRSINLSSSPKR